VRADPFALAHGIPQPASFCVGFEDLHGLISNRSQELGGRRSVAASRCVALRNESQPRILPNQQDTMPLFTRIKLKLGILQIDVDQSARR
jgi:hypothetical protein